MSIYRRRPSLTLNLYPMHLPAEFDPQSFIQLTWPHRQTDWAPIYDEVIECYCAMTRAIIERQPLIIVTQDVEETTIQLERHQIRLDNISLFPCPTNDTWARDHAFISCLYDGQHILMDFQFNGWGLKFPANYDNQINQKLYQSRLLNGIYTDCRDFVLEGGSIESDGRGTILTTTSCLLAPNRNGLKTKEEAEQQLRQFFGAERILWLDHSWLAGDDTDGHIDTIARFCSPDTIAYVQCTDSSDEHYAELQAMETELKQFTTLDGTPYRLIPLPLPRPIYDEGERLPATYANFLIMNTAVLLPTYGQPDLDALAAHQLKTAFPDRDIVSIDCRVLIRQHGSLHCSTMQYPE